MNKKFKRNKIIAISVIVLLVLCLIFLLVTGKRQRTAVDKGLLLQNRQKQSVIVSSDSQKEPLATTPQSFGQISVSPNAVKIQRAQKVPLTKPAGNAPDTSAAEDTAEAADTTVLSPEAQAANGCAGDTAKPWVYPDPSGGLHRAAISVTFASTKPCTIEWKTDGSAPWVVYRGESIPVTKTTTLFFRARDTCGNAMEPREELYELRPEETARFCPQGMEFVRVGETRYCIDKYEWPNRKGAVPRSFISLYQAMDSCVSAGKHLCTSDEWSLACTGPYGWKYPYGAAYEPHACNTQDTAVRPSGKKVECRGYFDVYDMAGNLAEWTNTKSDRNPQFYNVKGGFWESGPRSGCFDTRYSYYPQNRHNPVGFRCCKEARP
jgi:hypothetical protein